MVYAKRIREFSVATTYTIGRIVRRQALIMGFGDTFAVLGILLAIAAVLILLTKKSKASAVGAH
jgi:DHA2 family multidrug resistance protein